MAKPSLSTKTPDDPITNALIDQHPELLASPGTSRLALVEIIVPEIKRIVASGEQVAKVQITHLELLHGADATAGEELFTRIHFDRTGNKTRPNPGEAPAPLGTTLDGLGDDVDDGV